MSLAEFYIENGLDPSDPNHMDDFLDRMRHERAEEIEHQEVAFCGLMVAVDPAAVDPADSLPLDENKLDSLAATRGWTKLDTKNSTAPMASYKRDDVRLNFWLSTGTVGSYLDHPRQGKSQLFRRHIDMSQSADLFQNPRQHTGAGYHRRGSQHTQTRTMAPCRYGASCPHPNCRYEHPQSSSSPHGRGGGGRGPCRYGNRCTRPDCWFDHP